MIPRGRFRQNITIEKGSVLNFSMGDAMVLRAMVDLIDNVGMTVTAASVHAHTRPEQRGGATGRILRQADESRPDFNLDE